MDTMNKLSLKEQMSMLLKKPVATPQSTAQQVIKSGNNDPVDNPPLSTVSPAPVEAVVPTKSLKELMAKAGLKVNVKDKANVVTTEQAVVELIFTNTSIDNTIAVNPEPSPVSVVTRSPSVPVPNAHPIRDTSQDKKVPVPESWFNARRNTEKQKEAILITKTQQVSKDPVLNDEDVKRLLQDKTIPLVDRLALRRKLEQEAKDPVSTQSNKLVVSRPEVLAPEAAPIRPTYSKQVIREAIDSIATTVSSNRHEAFSLSVVLNARQQMAADYAAQGKCFVLTGPAGSGKTTALREVARSCLEKGTTGTHHFGYFDVDAPSIAFCAYTNRATDNMRKAIEKDAYLAEELKHNVLTIHKLLEYTMEWAVSEAGNAYPRFFPKRDEKHKLDITHLGIEEGSQVDIPLWRQLFAALRPGTIIMLIGDINQLPPVFGPSVFNYGLVQLPVIELNEVYRQALESPVLAAAHKVLKGEMPDQDGKFFKIYQSKPGSKSPSEQQCCSAFINTWKKWVAEGSYDVMTDICLSPYNKTDPGKDAKRDNVHYLSTRNLNYHMAQYLGDLRKVKVHEVLAGRNKWYLAEGDRVMIEKQDGVITKISMNGMYLGKVPMSQVNDINRFGKFTAEHHADSDIDDDDFELTGYENLNVDDIPDEEKATAASSVVEILMDNGNTVVLDTAGEFGDAKFSLGYCLSVHKAQGSEWRKVVFIMHKNFAPLMFRELVYTAITRAREYCTVIDMTNYFAKAISQQRIKGNTIDEKIEWFNSKLTMTEVVQIVP